MFPDFLTTTDIALLILGATITGFSKAGIGAIFLMVIPFFVNIFGGKVSASVILPLLLCGDSSAIIFYHKKISWHHFFRLIPFTIPGLAVGMVVGQGIPDKLFRIVLGCIILVCLILMAFKELSKKELTLPNNWFSHFSSGFSGGFASMVGNAGGPIMVLYLLSMRLPKEALIGTGALFFFVMNICKVPVHIFVWKTMTPETLKIDAILMLFVIMGFFIGLKIIRKIPEKPFRIIILLATLIGTLKMFF